MTQARERSRQAMKNAIENNLQPVCASVELCGMVAQPRADGRHMMTGDRGRSSAAAYEAAPEPEAPSCVSMQSGWELQRTHNNGEQ